MADEFSLLKCSNIGCRETFKWREQLRRHKTKCSFTPKEVAVKYKCLQDGTFQCETCYQPFTKQSNAYDILKRTIVTNLKKSKFMYATFVLRILHIKVILIDM